MAARCKKLRRCSSVDKCEQKHHAKTIEQPYMLTKHLASPPLDILKAPGARCTGAAVKQRELSPASRKEPSAFNRRVAGSSECIVLLITLQMARPPSARHLLSSARTPLTFSAGSVRSTSTIVVQRVLSRGPELIL